MLMNPPVFELVLVEFKLGKLPCVLYDIYKTDETGRHWLGSRSTLAQAEKQIKQLKE